LFSDGATWKPVPGCSKCGAPFASATAWQPSLMCATCGALFTSYAPPPQVSQGPQVETEPVQPVQLHRYPVEFTARAGEYFRIWIVNLVLTILTLGIYSAWAKVRKRRYFYAHTRIDGDSFDYRGQPMAILKGRFIAAAAFAAFYAVWHFAPSYIWVLLIGAVIAAPWLIVRSLAFNAHNSAYRNIRFHFRGRYTSCLGMLLWNGLLVIVTLGLGYPYLKSRFVQFMVANHSYGTTQFKIPELKPIFFRIYSWAIVVMFFGGILVGLITIPFLAPAKGTAMSVLSTIPTYLLYLFFFAYLRARLMNATFGNLVVGPVRFESTLRARDMFLLYLVNIVAIIATVGLATPWAQVRTMRYRAERVTLTTTGSIADFLAAEAGQVSAAGEEVAEMFDVDLSI
jgi:uncharacterized membrane protein YjgN (DUF898 family)